MRKNQYGDFRTLEQDIVWIWKLHGLKVIEEVFKNNTWKIKAEELDNGTEVVKSELLISTNECQISSKKGCGILFNEIEDADDYLHIEHTGMCNTCDKNRYDI